MIWAVGSGSGGGFNNGEPTKTLLPVKISRRSSSPSIISDSFCSLATEARFLTLFSVRVRACRSLCHLRLGMCFLHDTLFS